MDHDGRTGGTPDGPEEMIEVPVAARLHLHRGPAGMYVVVGLLMIVCVVFGVTSWIGEGKIVAPIVAGVVGLGIVGFLGLLTASIVIPELIANETGIAGKIDWNTTVDVRWDQVVIDLDEEASKGRFRLDLGGQEVVINRRSWLGFRDFVLLVATTSAAATRLTPGARTEILRLLGIVEEVAEPDEDPELSD